MKQDGEAGTLRKPPRSLGNNPASYVFRRIANCLSERALP